MLRESCSQGRCRFECDDGRAVGADAPARAGLCSFWNGLAYGVRAWFQPPGGSQLKLLREQPA
jgi:hypothetical protein